MGTPVHNKYIPIRMDDFTIGIKTPVDLYVRISETEFSKLYSAGEKTEQAKIFKFNRKSIGYLWVRNEEYPNLTKHNVLIAGIALKSDKYKNPEKSRFITAASATIFNEISQSGINHSNYNEAREISDATVSLVQHHQDLFELMENLSRCSDTWVKFSQSVAAMSVVIGNGMGWKNPVTMEKLAVGGLLHKIGFTDLPRELLALPIDRMSAQQFNTYKNYPTRGAQMLSKLGSVPDDIVAIVAEHQERPKGKGFPKKLTDLKVHPMARVVGLAEEFCQILIPNMSKAEDTRSPDQAFKVLKDTKEHMFNKEVFEGLHKMVGRNSLNKAV
ncbi:MAG: hypothetical protein CL677_06990 [Bdellovibrionaceae bacterium]|nr:hypothetical protein [Pseudobdellovibrionaceae bacterium]